MKKVYLAAGLAVVVLAGAGYAWRQKEKSASEAVAYERVAVKRATISLTILSTGLVKPENKLEIKPPIAGRVESVLVREGAKVKKGQTLAWMSSTERAAMLDAATARGPEELKKWEELYRPTPILAPINGTIIQRNVESGQTFATNDAVLVMSDRLTVKAQVDETDLAKVKLGQKASISLDAYSGEEILGTVDQIAYDATTVNNVTTYVVDVLPDTAPAHMRSGMTANVTFRVDERKDVLTVPADAIKVEGGRMTVLVEDPATKEPVKRAVRTGASDGKKTEILDGLTEGEPVLVVAFCGLGERKTGAASPFMGGPPRGKKKGK